MEEYEYAGFIFLVQNGIVLHAKAGQHQAAYKDKHKRAAQECYNDDHKGGKIG